MISWLLLFGGLAALILIPTLLYWLGKKHSGWFFILMFGIHFTDTTVQWVLLFGELATLLNAIWAGILVMISYIFTFFWILALQRSAGNSRLGWFLFILFFSPLNIVYWIVE